MITENSITQEFVHGPDARTLSIMDLAELGD